MKLTYRGVTYDRTAQAAPVYGPILAEGIYRGAKAVLRSLAKIPHQPRHLLTWRGARYLSGKAPQPVLAGAPSPELLKAVAASETAPTAETVPVVTPVPAMTPAMPPEMTPEMAPAAAPVLAMADRARSLLMRHHQRIRQREQSMLARLDIEVGLTAEDAAHYEGHRQGKTCHNFAGYDRSGATMS